MRHGQKISMGSLLDAWKKDTVAGLRAEQQPVEDNRGKRCVECGQVIGGLTPSTFRPEYCNRCAGDSLGERYDHDDDMTYRGED